MIQGFGELIDVAPNGNYGFLAVMLGLKKMGRLANGISISKFRKMLYLHGKDNQRDLYGDFSTKPPTKGVGGYSYFDNDWRRLRPRDSNESADAYQVRVQRVITSKRDKRGILELMDKWWAENVLAPIYQHGTDYEVGARTSSWFDAKYVCPILCHKYGVVVFAYQPNATGHSRTST